MSDHEEDVSNSLNDVKTKNKHENAKREYGCPCGKEYLSYPALFTHIKQKHGGKVTFLYYQGSRRVEETKN